MTVRPLNTCHDCDYEWYPRGHDYSNNCPDCGAEQRVYVSEPDNTPYGAIWAVILTPILFVTVPPAAIVPVLIWYGINKTKKTLGMSHGLDYATDYGTVTD